MNRAFASLALALFLVAGALALPQGARAVTDDQCALLSPSSATVMELYEVRMRLTVGTSPIADGGLRVSIPDGWSAPQMANATAEGYTEVVAAYGAFAVVSDVACDGMNVTASIAGAQPGDIVYVKYGSGGLARAPLVLGAYGFAMEVSRGAGFEAVSGSPMTLPVTTGGFAGFRMLLPGEAAADGTVEGKSGAPLPLTAGVPFNVTFQTVDAGNNLVPMNSSGEYLVRCGDFYTYPPNGIVAGLDFVNGEVIVQMSLRPAGWNELMILNSTLAEFASVGFDVSPAAPAMLQLLVPGLSPAPGDVAGGGCDGSPAQWMAGVPYPFEVRVVDAFYNVNTTSERPISVVVAEGNATVDWLNATTSGGVARFEAVLPDAAAYALNASAPSLAAVAIALPAQKLGRMLAIADEAVARIDGGPYGPYTARVVDNNGQPFPGANVSFAFASAPAGFALDRAWAVTGADGTATAWVDSCPELGDYTVLASCGSVPGSPLAMTLSVVDVDAPSSFILTADGTVGPSFEVEAAAYDLGGGDVAEVELWYRTGSLWLVHSSLGAAPWTFAVDWTLGSCQAEFGVLARDDQGNAQDGFAGTLSLAIDASSPALVRSDLPAHSRPVEVEVTVELSEEIGSDGLVLLDGADAGATFAHPDASSVSFALDLSGLSEGPHTLSLEGFSDAFGNAMPTTGAGTVVVDGTAPLASVIADIPAEAPLGQGAIPLAWSFSDAWGLSGFEVTVNGEPAELDGPCGAAAIPVPATGATVTIGYEATDLAGNAESGTIGPFSIDRTAPSIASLSHSYIPQTGDWIFTASATDASGAARAWLLYGGPGRSDLSAQEMAPSPGGFKLLTSLGGLSDAEVAVVVHDAAWPANAARLPSEGTMRVTAPSLPEVMGHSPPDRFLPGQALELRLQCDFGASSATLLWSQGDGYAETAMAGGPEGWVAEISPASLAELSYYFIAEGPDGPLALYDSGAPFVLEPRLPSSSVSWSSPAPGTIEIVFPAPMDRASVERNLTLSSGAGLAWRDEGQSDVLVVSFEPGSGDMAATVGAGSRTADGFALEAEVTAVTLSADAEGEAPAPLLALGIVAATLFALLAAAGVALRTASERGRFK